MSHLHERLTPLKGHWDRIAKLAGVSPMTVYRIVWGEQRDHKLTTYQKISAAIDLVQLENKVKEKAPA